MTEKNSETVSKQYADEEGAVLLLEERATEQLARIIELLDLEFTTAPEEDAASGLQFPVITSHSASR